MTFTSRLSSFFYHPILRSSLATIKYAFICHFIVTHIGHIALTEGPSMLPTIDVRGAWVYIDNTHSRGRRLKVGDVVDFYHPLVYGQRGIKRIAGMPGDFVVKDGGEGKGKMMIQVPEGHCWLLGDNLSWSRDSRTYGPVPLALIKGKVIAKVWPMSGMGRIKNRLQEPEE